MDYTTLSLTDVKNGLAEIAREAEATFGALDAWQLNWRPDAARWSVAQCFEHLLTSNRLMLRSADDALNPAHPQSVWQRLPVLPGVMGRIMVRSQAPETTRKFKAPTPARPSSSDIGADVIQRFVEQHRDAVVRVAALDEGRAARTIMSSPYVRIITYSVLDGWRLMVAHDRRHVEQARRVTQAAEISQRVIRATCKVLQCNVLTRATCHVPRAVPRAVVRRYHVRRARTCNGAKHRTSSSWRVAPGT